MIKKIKNNSKPYATYTDRVIAFAKAFQNEVAPIFKDYEVYRLQEFNKHKPEFILLILGGIVSLLLLIIPIIYKNLVLFFICFVINGIFYYYVVEKYCKYIHKKNKEFQNSLKRVAFKNCTNCFGDIEWENYGIYDRAYSFLDYNFKASGLFSDYNLKATDDVFTGTYKGISYKITETTMIYRLVIQESNFDFKVFKGIIIEFECNKKIKNRTIVSTKGDLTTKNKSWYTILTSCLIATIFALPTLLPIFFENIRFIILLLFAIIISTIMISTLRFEINKMVDKELRLDKLKKLELVTLESPEFNKKFNVYSSDQVEARYLVTTSFMERFQNLKTHFGAKKAKCSFYDGNKIMFAIHTDKDLFELGDLYHPLLDSNSHNDLFETLNSIFDMIEYFKLDEKTGL